MTTIKIVNTETGQETERAMNAEELAQQAVDDEAYEAAKAAQAAKATEQAALLARLGISESEAALLLS
jgi:hypothetical protein